MLAALLSGEAGPHAIEASDFLRNICLAAVAAAAGGIAARMLRQPLMVGFLVGGIAVGPAAFNVVGDAYSIYLISEIGPALFQEFSVGVEPRELNTEPGTVIHLYNLATDQGPPRFSK